MACPAPEGVERLLALEDIRLLRAQYCRFIDSRQFSRLAHVLTEDAVLDMSPTGKVLGATVEPIHGRGNIIGMMEKVFVSLQKLLHVVTSPEIAFQDGEHATGVWRQETFIKENRPDIPGTGIAYATVFDGYRKERGRWLIASVRVDIDLVL
jgi:ketosteroid isomerase-like protein